ncbi:MAG: septal ring lytic transglycosylase RlpA family protein [Bernardetiaceae bacterium]|jgi:rare lipoprotein A|nr:septal ring lytic transglycosylase RlpA family protein [Bernardetiaceae bacterium]
MRNYLWLLLLLISLLEACRARPNLKKGFVQTGQASYYADKFHGRPTASGQTYDRRAFTAAHRDLPFGTRVRVRNLANNKTVEVTINDRGPFIRGRVIDLSRAAAEQIDLVRPGVAKVEIRPAD